jgi:hypothetical protein
VVYFINDHVIYPLSPILSAFLVCGEDDFLGVAVTDTHIRCLFSEILLTYFTFNITEFKLSTFVLMN